MDNNDLGRVPAAPGSHEPSPAVSAASGFDPSRIVALEAEILRLREDKARLDFLDRCNQRLNEQYGTTYRWELILNHNVNRLMLGNSGGVDLNDTAANGLRSCREAIDAAMVRTRATLNPTTHEGEGR